MFFKLASPLISLLLMIIFSSLFLSYIKVLKKDHEKLRFNIMTIELMLILSKLYRNYPSLIMKLSKFSNFKASSDNILRSIVFKSSLGYEDKSALTKAFSSVEHHPYVTCLLYDVVEGININSSQSIVSSLQFSESPLKLRSLFTLITAGTTLAPIPLTLLALFYQQDVTLFLPLVLALFYGALLCLALFIMKKLTRTFI